MIESRAGITWSASNAQKRLMLSMFGQMKKSKLMDGEDEHERD